MKIMVCLISNQHVPNLLGVQAVQPDRLVLLVTPAMKGKEENLLKALNTGNCDYNLRHDVIEITDENSVGAVYTALTDLHSRYPDDEWVVNLTGGTKPMSMGAYLFSRKQGLKTLYIAEKDQRRAVDLLDNSALTLDYQVSTAEFLAGYGFDLQNQGMLAQNEGEAEQRIEVATLLAAHHDDPSLRRMLGRLQKLKEEKKKTREKEGLDISKKDDVSLNDPTLRSVISQEFSFAESGARLSGHLDKHAVEFLTGKWLEVFVWSLLRPFVGHGIWDLHLGAVIAGGKGPGESNEFDVSFMQDQSLCIVECKTGEQDHDPEASTTLYKIEAIKSGLTALRMKTYLATTSPNVIDQKSGDIKRSIANRCMLYGCTVIYGAPLKEMAELALRHDPSLHEKIAATFHLKLQGVP